ncbi:cytidine deaminase [Bacillus sp. AFS006103]|nr:cytidine deaminase [Bacillus sp. AFS006103]
MITKEDEELVEIAKELIKQHYHYGKHHVACAVRMKNNLIFKGIHLKANVGRATICAESVALGQALTNGEKEFDTIVAVKHPSPNSESSEIMVVSPCGVCRELISDYCSDMKVIIPGENQIAKRHIHELLPSKFE